MVGLESEDLLAWMHLGSPKGMFEQYQIAGHSNQKLYEIDLYHLCEPQIAVLQDKPALALNYSNFWNSN